MESFNYPWGHSRPFNAYSNYFKIKYGQRLQKLSIDAGFTCPNRDGKISFHGCSFCDNNAFNPSYCEKNKSIYQQIEEGIEFHAWRYKNVKNYLAYFQAYSNTYAPLEVLKQRYEEALSHPSVIGLVIGTRPDCVDEKILDYLAELQKEYHIIVEYGIESCYDKTLKRINRGHSFAQTVEAIEKTASRGITIGGHIIFGLPGESIEMMQNEAKILSSLPLHSVKFHQLILVKNTPIIKDYQENPNDFVFMKFEQYKEFMIDFLEKLSPNIVIERFAGEVPPRFQAGGSNWELLRNETLVSKIEQRMIERNTYQGRLYKP
ncbi:MAG: TIGR01212 family radical SAM protein [Bacteroidales bacterium]|nr:TIGR01212 family radical SAM protein [Bacteroidales bacterium]MBQ5891345.1 TIGR01212 family radical SAM protein [Bacteroidales bacterium]MEE1271588.1 TIGR01212 family radical SAM protein [Bacteroidales bacterium]